MDGTSEQENDRTLAVPLNWRKDEAAHPSEMRRRTPGENEPLKVVPECLIVDFMMVLHFGALDEGSE